MFNNQFPILPVTDPGFSPLYFPFIYFNIFKNYFKFAFPSHTYSHAHTNEEPGTLHAGIAQLVEHDLAKVGVAGSSPVFRSKM
jgi:hypothetical protein